MLLNKELYDEYKEWLKSIEDEDLRAVGALLKERCYPYALYILLLAFEKFMKTISAALMLRHVHEIGEELGHNVFNMLITYIEGIVRNIETIIESVRHIIEYLHGYTNAVGISECRNELHRLTEMLSDVNKSLKGIEKTVRELRKLSNNIVKGPKIKSTDVMYLWYATLGLEAPIRNKPDSVREFIRLFNELKDSITNLSNSFSRFRKCVEGVCECLSGSKDTAFAVLTVLGSKLTAEELRPLIDINHSIKRLKTYLDILTNELQLSKLNNYLSNLGEFEAIFILSVSIHLNWIRYPPSEYIRKSYREAPISKYLNSAVQVLKKRIQDFKNLLHEAYIISKLTREYKLKEALEILKEITNKIK